MRISDSISVLHSQVIQRRIIEGMLAGGDVVLLGDGRRGVAEEEGGERQELGIGLMRVAEVFRSSLNGFFRGSFVRARS